MIRQSTICAVSLLALLAPGSVSAQPHDHDHGKHVEFKKPETYKAAVEEIQLRLHEIDHLIKTKELENVHGQAEIIQKVGNMIGQLALKADSGVPKSAVKEVNIAGRSLAAKFDAIDKAGDSGDLAGTKKEYDEMVKLAEILDKYVPKVFACPMKCEGEKTYPQAGKCPKCGMAITLLKSHADHEAKHGGTFFMAPDNKHHLEGTISAKKEFRIYFYDEYTKPIEPGKFTAEGTAWTSGKDVDKPLKMTVGPRKEFLTGQVDDSIAFPIRVKLFIDFKDKEKPQVFDFEFTEPSKEPADTDKDKEKKHTNEGKHDAKH